MSYIDVIKKLSFTKLKYLEIKDSIGRRAEVKVVRNFLANWLCKKRRKSIFQGSTTVHSSLNIYNVTSKQILRTKDWIGKERKTEVEVVRNFLANWLRKKRRESILFFSGIIGGTNYTNKHVGNGTDRYRKRINASRCKWGGLRPSRRRMRSITAFSSAWWRSTQPVRPV